jgi:glycosyltransferase involved in cell wall biosynthesis
MRSITVLNAASTIRKCLDSVLAQKGVHIQLIVMDGGSSDGTCDIVVGEYVSRLGYFQSEKDDGIYDAWNKAILYSCGDWVCFIGADDAFVSGDSLKQLIDVVQDPDVDLAISRGTYVDSAGRRIRDFGGPWDWNKLIHYVTFCHPGTLHSRTLLSRVGPFDTRYRIAADYDFFMRAGPSTKAVFLNHPTILVGADGVSRTRAQLAFGEHAEIQSRYKHLSSAAIARGRFVAVTKYLFRRILRLA